METNSKTLIVVMPVYNSEKTLDAAISSVLNQSYTNLRLFVVDDFSTDSSVVIAKKYLSDPRVRLFRNNKNMGAYYSRNIGLYHAQNIEWGYFTSHDSDDVSFENRYSKIITKIENSVNSVGAEDRVRRIDFYTRKTIREHGGECHAVFKRIVFQKIGYFEAVRFGADWEHWERVSAWAKNSGFVLNSISTVLGNSYVHEKNLTVLIPSRSRARREYVERSKKRLSLMYKRKQWHRPFKASSVTEELKNSYDNSKEYKEKTTSPKNNPVKNAPKVTVVLLTWQRLQFLKKTLLLLSNQTYKDFDIRITNANLERSNAVERIADQFNNKLKISITHDGNDIKNFRRFTVGNDLATKGTEVVLFIDDDITFSNDYVERLVSSYEPKTYKSGFAWNFQRGGESYYKHRTRRWDNEEKIHYCGTGISMIDASIFLDKRLFAAPKEAHYVEDIWLSYFAQHVMKWELKYVNVGNVHIGGTDQHALYKQIMRDKKLSSVPDKADFLTLLVKRYGWKL
jgi:glycosyltransferase involved in cell wall biosynthesis